MSTRGHTTRDDRDRRRPARDDRPSIRDDPPAPSRGGRGETLNDFFMDGKGIHREVLQREICKYLGPEAFSRPYNYNGVSGYTITAVRPFTSKMIDDLQDLSRSYVNENVEAVRKGHQEIPYEQSKAAMQAIRNVEDPYDQPGYPSHMSYSMANAQSGYAAPSRPEYPPLQGGAYSGSVYSPPNPGYAAGPGYGQPSPYPSSARPSTNDSYAGSNYGSDPYGDESPRPLYPGGSRSQIRPDPRPDPRDPRDVRDPRPDPRADPRLDPRYAMADPRMEYSHIRDSRPDPRTSNYPYPPVNSPAEFQMRGYTDEYAASSVQMGRGGPAYAPPSRALQTGYDTREPVQVRDSYRQESIREERRRR